jgi:hypothetical protein
MRTFIIGSSTIERVAFELGECVGVVQGPWNRFKVFEIGDEEFFVFALLDRRGSITRLQFPVRKADLKQKIKIGQRWPPFQGMVEAERQGF